MAESTCGCGRKKLEAMRGLPKTLHLVKAIGLKRPAERFNKRMIAHYSRFWTRQNRLEDVE